MWFEEDDFWVNFKEMMFDPDRMHQTKTDVSQMITLANLRPKMKIFDHCCGFGRHALEFAKLGFETTGVELNPSYLNTAIAKSKKHNVSVNWVQSDVREFKQENYFDFAYNFFTSIGYFDNDDDEILSFSNVYASLKKGGKFLIDVEGKETLAKNFCDSQWFDGQDGSIMLVGAEITDNWTKIENRWGYIKDGIYKEKIFSNKIYSAYELALLLSKAGFSQIEFYGSLEGIPYNQDAERLIAVAVK